MKRRNYSVGSRSMEKLSLMQRISYFITLLNTIYATEQDYRTEEVKEEGCTLRVRNTGSLTINPAVSSYTAAKTRIESTIRMRNR